jgi:3',5'-cyclic AMP phosphodiesterase CpdA
LSFFYHPISKEHISFCLMFRNFVLFCSVLVAIAAILLFPSLEQNNIQIQNKSEEIFEDEIFWFLQVSDIHISNEKIETYKKRLQRFEFLIQFLIKKMIQPEFVLATGDLTHALDNRRSGQVLEEWKFYMNTLERNGLYKSDFWYDLKGNHDSFNVEGKNEQNNFYKDYSVSRQFIEKPLMTHVYKTKRASYKFIGLDATKEYGFSRLFNFFGVFNQNAMNSLEAELKKNSQYNQTILYGHYPQAFIESDLTSSGLIMKELSTKYRYLAHLSG